MYILTLEVHNQTFNNMASVMALEYSIYMHVPQNSCPSSNWSELAPHEGPGSCTASK